MRVQEKLDSVKLIGNTYSISVNKGSGLLTAYEYNGISLLQSGPMVNIWRATIDNDSRQSKEWKKAGFDAIQHRMDDFSIRFIEEQAAVISVKSTLGAAGLGTCFNVWMTYSVYGSEDVIITTRVLPKEGLPPLPRLGLQMIMPGTFDRLSWFGLGPHECYIDRKVSGRLGVYGGTVQEQFVPYIKPQENGNKADARWAAVTNAMGTGLYIGGMPTFDISASHYDVNQVAKAKHTTDLVRLNETFVNMDYRQAPIGNHSCGEAPPLDCYMLHPEETTFTLRFKPFSNRDISPVQLNRRWPEPIAQEISASSTPIPTLKQEAIL
ncbi:beta-galactosidase small subunit [Paenibacillus hexagrammi]|uniref:beta-galactosidase n=2 Tax=Paenibacillus hexagrammi TaxID=2908839 RepID=A0ABY3SSB3_9BACL|nr:beta-galactosidase small subunit [Paenibacillus sp. YPD9-1]